ncbi:hypothetical protein KF4_062 [Vibrio phage vB_VpaS_KF4]|nr:hypothetical protein KF3_028 [Vibrio phage vB_VpaS_KF3]ATI19275.1 hypothetical protein KF4_062 [Vibrio phage vB_VpaS_KF4]
MSLTKAILEELIAATNTPRGKRESHEKHLQKIVKAVGALDDDQWDALSDEAADWYNDAVNAINDGQDIPGSENDPFEAAEEETKPTRSRRGRNTQTEETENKPMKKVLVAIALAEIAKGSIVTVTCGDDVFEGEVTAVTKKGRGKNAKVEEFTLKTADGDEVFGAEDLLFDEGDKIERHDEVTEEEKKPARSRRGAKKEEAAEEETKTAGRGSRRGAKKEEAKPEPVEVETEIEFNDIAKGDKLKLQVEDDAFEGEVKAVKKSGRGKNAKVAEFTLTTADGEEVFEADHIVIEEGDKIIRVTMEDKAPAKEEKAASGRRGRGNKAASETPAAQARRLICENLDAEKSEVSELMAEKGIDMKASTFDVLYSEAHSLIAVLREMELLA